MCNLYVIVAEIYRRWRCVGLRVVIVDALCRSQSAISQFTWFRSFRFARRTNLERLVELVEWHFESCAHASNLSCVGPPNSTTRKRQLTTFVVRTQRLMYYTILETIGLANLMVFFWRIRGLRVFLTVYCVQTVWIFVEKCCIQMYTSYPSLNTSGL